MSDAAGVRLVGESGGGCGAVDRGVSSGRRWMAEVTRRSRSAGLAWGNLGRAAARKADDQAGGKCARSLCTRACVRAC
eukprot:98496-Pelagomonas_calceolata.AAC.1